jgi:hypothetical protein
MTINDGFLGPIDLSYVYVPVGCIGTAIGDLGYELNSVSFLNVNDRPM